MSNKKRVVFFGATIFSEEVLCHLLQYDCCEVVGIGTLETPLEKSDRVQLSAGTLSHDVPVVTDCGLDLCAELRPDIILAVGYPKIIPRSVLTKASMVGIGYHPAKLPEHRGHCPIIWPLVLGLAQTASTFFTLEETVDSGRIISTKPVAITGADDAGTLYEKLIAEASKQLREIFEGDQWNCSRPQSGAVGYWRKRVWLDGRIDWRMPSQAIINLVKALRPPYPGAVFYGPTKTHTLHECRFIPCNKGDVEPGKLIDTNVIKTGDGALRLLSFEPKCVFREGGYLL